VIRGGRQRAIASRTAAAEKPKEHSRFAALPPGSSSAPTATDAPPIIVLRGARTRYAHVGRIEPPQPPAHPLLTVIRGARPQLVRLQLYVQPGPLILRIPD
jgi:hypothetical protein